MSSIMLICAVLVSLAAGVLLAYGICQGMFRVFRVQSIAAAQKRTEMLEGAAAPRMHVA